MSEHLIVFILDRNVRFIAILNEEQSFNFLQHPFNTLFLTFVCKLEYHFKPASIHDNLLPWWIPIVRIRNTALLALHIIRFSTLGYFLNE